MTALVFEAFVLLIALEHLWFMILEMVLWQRPIGLKTFRMTAAEAKQTAVLAMNQGLYNGFLCAGVTWAAVSREAHLGFFFLGCVSIAGIFGGITVNRRIFYLQALPALLALGFLAFFGA